MIDHAEVQSLVYKEARYLDLGRWDDWLALFAEDCRYWIPIYPDQTDPKQHISLFYEDRVLMETRIRRLRHPSAHSLVLPIRTSHVLSGMMVEPGPESEDEVVAVSSFLVLEQHGDSQRFFGGLVTHTIQSKNGELRIGTKRVDLTNCDSAHQVIEVFI